MTTLFLKLSILCDMFTYIYFIYCHLNLVCNWDRVSFLQKLRRNSAGWKLSISCKLTAYKLRRVISCSSGLWTGGHSIRAIGCLFDRPLLLDALIKNQKAWSAVELTGNGHHHDGVWSRSAPLVVLLIIYSRRRWWKKDHVHRLR